MTHKYLFQIYRSLLLPLLCDKQLYESVGQEKNKIRGGAWRNYDDYARRPRESDQLAAAASSIEHQILLRFIQEKVSISEDDAYSQIELTGILSRRNLQRQYMPGDPCMSQMFNRERAILGQLRSELEGAHRLVRTILITPFSLVLRLHPCLLRRQSLWLPLSVSVKGRVKELVLKLSRHLENRMASSSEASSSYIFWTVFRKLYFTISMATMFPFHDFVHRN